MPTIHKNPHPWRRLVHPSKRREFAAKKTQQEEAVEKRIDHALREPKKTIEVLKPGKVKHKCFGCGKDIYLETKTTGAIWCSMTCCVQNTYTETFAPKTNQNALAGKPESKEQGFKT